jgi:hypothetical protein
MSKMKSLFAALLLTAIVGVVPQAHAQTGKVILAGSSAMWQTIALAAWNNGNCVTGGTAPCKHATYAGVKLVDSRNAAIPTGETGNLWVVWDSASPTNFWAYLTVDSVVGNRCYFAQPRCTIGNGAAGLGAIQNKIAGSIWGNDTDLATDNPAVYAMFTASTGPQVNAAATDIRPEDALFAQCRVNSKLGGGVDGLAGLGYGNGVSGSCPSLGAPLANKIGAQIKSGYPGSTALANVVAFNIVGHDPFNTTLVIPTFTSVSVGADPIVFLTNRTSALAGVKNATESQLQTAFSGTQCTGSVFAGGTAANIAVYLREPLSGTMNTTEATVFRRPNVSGVSQEKGVSAANPLAARACAAGGARWRAIGTGEEVKAVLNSNANFGMDGIGYAFFSYGNVSSIANNANYGYLQLNGIDPIFHVYGTTIDPGQPAIAGALPSTATLPAACAGAFPCAEKLIWSGNLSFPNLRHGSYRAWSVLRLVSDGAALANVKLLATGSNAVAANITPDYVPFAAVGAVDPGLSLLRSHYTQEGVSPANLTGLGTDKGGDMGGCILVSTKTLATTDLTVKLAQGSETSGCVVVP